MSIIKDAVQGYTEYVKEVEELNDINVQPKYNDVPFDTAYTVVEGVKEKRKVGFMDRMAKATIKDTGCAEPTNNYDVADSEKEWNPQRLEFATKMCYANFEATFLRRKLGNGKNANDLTQSDVIDFVINDIISEGLYEDRKRIAEFADTAIVSGSLTNGASDVPNYDQIDAIWKQIFAEVNGGSATSTALAAANAEATTAAQLTALKSGDANGAISNAVFTGLAEEADSRIFNGNEMFMVSRSVLMNYKRYLRSFGTEIANQVVIDGRPFYSFDGIPIVEMKDWDRNIKADFETSGALDLPHRAILTTKDQLQIATDSISAIDDVELWYDGKTKDITIRVQYLMDALIMRPELIAAAY